MTLFDGVPSLYVSFVSPNISVMFILEGIMFEIILSFETSPYFEYSIREVKETIKEDSESDDEDY